ncbi:MAG: hypothetical protein ACRCX7_08620, partial [Cetobacterium sp.]|uniref:hypothetical protein n=1 Tax=Cetobacterium sp. TaxID=2071632 RepID=UPI003F37AAA6
MKFFLLLLVLAPPLFPWGTSLHLRFSVEDVTSLLVGGGGYRLLFGGGRRSALLLGGGCRSARLWTS